MKDGKQWSMAIVDYYSADGPGEFICGAEEESLYRSLVGQDVECKFSVWGQDLRCRAEYQGSAALAAAK